MKEVIKVGRIPDETAPCGIYCGACPSLKIRKTCLGCGSEDRKQKRKSKWSCGIRRCCFEDKNLNFCIDCADFPCKKIDKLKNSHTNKSKFRYRHEIYDNLKNIKEYGIENWLKEQERKYKCPQCKGNLVWYEYKCESCDYEQMPK